MKRIYAFTTSLVLLMATPGLATADTYFSPTSRQQAINYVIARALSQRGVPYAYGGGNATGPSLGTGSSPVTITATAPAAVPGAITAPVPDAITATAPAPAPKTVGFDASGLIVYAFAGVGIKLPRSSGEQYKVGRKVLPAQALPGDLIFYGPDGTQSVALFVGNGQMLEATDPVVTVSPVRTGGMTPYLTRIIEQ
jgi:cell wall-associated NlpC family hydrolase